LAVAGTTPPRVDFAPARDDNRPEALAKSSPNGNPKPVSPAAPPAVSPAVSPADLPAARAALVGARAWLVTDGKAGDLAHCLGIAERLGLAAESRIVAPRPPWSWAMPHLWRWPALGIDPAEAPGRAGGPLAGPMPDLAIASGRRAAAYLPAIKRAGGGWTFTIFLKDPRTAPAIADFLWVPAHDRLRGANVLTTPLSPHRITQEALAAARGALRPEIAARTPPRVAVLIGGNSRDFRFAEDDIARFASQLAALAGTGARLMATTSRRTPAALAEAARAAILASGGWLWDGTGENPYRELLAGADAVLVTADSVNMIGEACATGRPVMVFRPAGRSRKIDRYIGELEAAGAVRPFSGRLESYTYPPMDATPAIAVEIARRYLRFRQEQGS
jgi:hypothetical protein